MSFVLTGLEDKVAVISGAGRKSSIGHDMAHAFAVAGARVAVTGTGRNVSDTDDWRDVHSLVDELEALGCEARAYTTLIDDAPSVTKLAQDVVSDFGRVDVVVNSAAAPLGPDRARITEVPDEAWRAVIDINVNGTFYMCKQFAPLLAQSGGGSIINISSLAAKLGPPERGAYAASKLAVNALTATLSKELGPSGIRVNAICPGYIATERNESRSPAERAEMVARIPLGRAGKATDIAALAVFLASNEGSWISGQQWNVDGGQLSVH